MSSPNRLLTKLAQRLLAIGINFNHYKLALVREPGVNHFETYDSGCACVLVHIYTFVFLSLALWVSVFPLAKQSV